MKKGYVVWNDDKVKIGQLINLGKTDDKMKEETGLPISKIKAVRGALNKGQELPTDIKEGEVTPAPKGTTAETTTEITEASILRLVPKVQSLSLTPDIFIGFMAAIARGFPGDIEDWLSLASRDFWLGRNRDFYAEVSGIQMKK